MKRKNYAMMAAEADDPIKGTLAACQEIMCDLQGIMNPISKAEIPMFIFCLETLSKTQRAELDAKGELFISIMPEVFGSTAYTIPFPTDKK